MITRSLNDGRSNHKQGFALTGTTEKKHKNTGTNIFIYTNTTALTPIYVRQKDHHEFLVTNLINKEVVHTTSKIMHSIFYWDPQDPKAFWSLFLSLSLVPSSVALFFFLKNLSSPSSLFSAYPHKHCKHSPFFFFCFLHWCFKFYNTSDSIVVDVVKDYCLVYNHLRKSC